ncbi:WD repeat-containing protein 75 [Drosophila grimshawi]|uniref:GH11333 n=1 Tax=Drosophila grimshawi TaxID=7222 RepID=B4JE95_DROGR|nr:WD repeat-containing protein 75 [Drosophila grimshawi]EDW03615.1 GH11333 [Drosophila grimshawi]
MNFNDDDGLELQHLAGGNIVKHAPVFSAQGRFIFVRCGLKVQVFVTSTGELTRELNDAQSPLISLELDVQQPELLLGCTSTGQLLRWHWRTGVLQKNISLKLGEQGLQILTCNLLNLYKEGDTACAFVTAKRKSGEQILWFVVNTSTGNVIPIKCGLKLKVRVPLVDVGKGTFKFVIIAQGYYVYFLNYETWKFCRYKNTHTALVTCVRMSPCEEMAATGDEKGRVIIWRQFDNQERVLCAEHHWHNTGVTSIAFTPSGVSFYSAGHEAVLVKWSLANSNERNFVPRMSSIIRHILISDGNEHVLACTDDNALHFISPSEMMLKSALQHFTYALPDKTGKTLFPIGLSLNPRTNTLVLNGRIGHLQFYSAYTKSLLYNLRVVESNVNSQEAKRIIYNTCVTRAAFNIDWMATGEVYNDHRNFAELRLKFWQYQERLQSYKLNTNIELPHEHGFQAIIFSNQFQVNNLRCATAGKDNVIKLWTVGDSENIYKRGTMWSCAAQASYKRQSLGSICFSQDGSLLAAGYGSTLVLYDARTLRLLHALSSSAGYDGVVAKAQLRLAQMPVNGTRTELQQQRQQLYGLLQTLLDSNDQKLVKQARQLIASAPSSQCKSSNEQTPKDAIKENVYKHIMQMSELGLHQKLQLLRRFGIECTVHEACHRRLRMHLQNCVVDPMAVQRRLKTLEARLHRLQPRQRFKAKQRLARLSSRRKNYEQLVRQELLPLFSVLHLDETTKPTAATAAATKRKRWETKPAKAPQMESAPLQSCAQISHVQFGAGAQAHLVAVCTETRVLIWNLMTLRLQAGLKLSVRQLAFDPLTNLIAAITRNDELHVFQPNVPLPVYQRCNLPKLHGLVWLPRRQPKQSSINVDWQAQSTLHMLTHDKEIVYLAQPGHSTMDDALAPISFAQPPVAEQLLQYATFGSFVAKQKSGEKIEIAKTSGPLIVGRGVHSSVNALVNLSAHTMPAMSLICGEFVKSLLTPAESTIRHNAAIEETLSNGRLNGNGIAHEDSDLEQDEEHKEDGVVYDKVASEDVRKTLLEQNTVLEQQSNSQEDEHLSLDARLKSVTQLDVHLEF